jgi:hypothetical protein
MERKKTMAPKTMLPEKMVPYTMGTLDRKSLGLTSSTIMARLFCGDGKGQAVSAQFAQGWAGNARRYARRRL